jgi:tetratricopeptide (TPR) repeat protein
MSKYDTDLDYVIPGIDITREELREIKTEADKIISDHNESKENRAVAYLKKAQCLRKLEEGHTVGFIYYEEPDSIFYDDSGIWIKAEDIERLLKFAISLSPNMPEVYMQLGLLNNGFFDADKEKAMPLLTKAIQLKPDYAAALNNRAMIFRNSFYSSILTDNQQEKDDFEKNKRNDFRSAVADLTEAIRIRPFDAIYNLNRATFHSKLGEHKEAVEDFNKAIDYAKGRLKEKLITEVLIFKLRGNEYLELKEYGKAIEDFSEALRLNPDDEGFPKITFFKANNSALLLRARAYYLAGEKDKTKEVFEEFLSRMRNDADTAGREKIYELTGLRPEDI